jgi:predicted TPR repeat methyltransferase
MGKIEAGLSIANYRMATENTIRRDQNSGVSIGNEGRPLEISSAMSDGRKLVVGAAPAGAGDPRSSARAVREMFTSIAPRYDLLNHVLSLNVDRLWWRRTAQAFSKILAQPDARVLDLCCGTGDMTFALGKQSRNGGAQILGACGKS